MGKSSTYIIFALSLVLWLQGCDNKESRSEISNFGLQAMTDSIFIDATSPLYDLMSRLRKWEYSTSDIKVLTDDNQFLIIDHQGNLQIRKRLVKGGSGTFPNGLASGFWTVGDRYYFYFLGKNHLKAFDSKLDEVMHVDLAKRHDDPFGMTYGGSILTGNELLLTRWHQGKPHYELFVFNFETQEFKKTASKDLNFPPINFLNGRYGNERLFVMENRGKILHILDRKGGLIEEQAVSFNPEDYSEGKDLIRRYFQNGLGEWGLITDAKFIEGNLYFLVNLNPRKKKEGLKDPYFLIEQNHAGFNIHQFTGIEKVHLDDYGNYKTVKKGPEGLYLIIRPLQW